MALDKVTTGVIADVAVTDAQIADDAVTDAKLGITRLSTSETAPVSPTVGQRWYKATTGVTYQYTANADDTKFWLDVSSGGIGTSASKSVDFVGDTDPHKATNGSGLAVGNVYYNRVKNKHFVCTDATAGANVWSGRYDGWGGVTTDYLSGSTYYRVHTFLTNGIFIPDVALTADVLIVGGGGSGGSGTGGGGGGAAVLYRAGLSMPAVNYVMTIGAGAVAPAAADNSGTVGGSTTFAAGSSAVTPTTAVGGGGGAGEGLLPSAAGSCANNGGNDYDDAAGEQVSPSGQGAASGWTIYAGNKGAVGGTGGSTYPCGGGGGASNTAGTPTAPTVSSAGGVGGAGIQIDIDGNNDYWGGGGGGSTGGGSTDGGAGGSGGGGGGGSQGGTGGVGDTNGRNNGGSSSGSGSSGGAGGANTGGGGGGGPNDLPKTGGAGGSGIVIIRYAIT